MRELIFEHGGLFQWGHFTSIDFDDNIDLTSIDCNDSIHSLISNHFESEISDSVLGTVPRLFTAQETSHFHPPAEKYEPLHTMCDYTWKCNTCKFHVDKPVDSMLFSCVEVYMLEAHRLPCNVESTDNRHQALWYMIGRFKVTAV